MIIILLFLWNATCIRMPDNHFQSKHVVFTRNNKMLRYKEQSVSIWLKGMEQFALGLIIVNNAVLCSQSNECLWNQWNLHCAIWSYSLCKTLPNDNHFPSSVAINLNVHDSAWRPQIPVGIVTRLRAGQLCNCSSITGSAKRFFSSPSPTSHLFRG